MKALTNFADQRLFGFHQLGSCGILADNENGRKQLEDAALHAMQASAKVFEIVCAPFCTLPPSFIAQTLTGYGIRHIAYCIVFTQDDKGRATDGDPISHLPDEQALATQTFLKHLAYIRDLQACGMTVSWITGPSCFVLGREYNEATLWSGGTTRTREQMDWAIARFYQQFIDDLASMGVKVCLEFLRPEEDRGALSSLKNVLDVIGILGGKNGQFRAHLDIFHALKRGMDPVGAVLQAGPLLGYVHAHGDNRIVPGTWLLPSEDGEARLIDPVNWWNVGNALDEVEYAGPITCEPFCDAIRRDIPVLGVGLPPATRPDIYYQQARRYFERMSILTMVD